MLTSLAYIFLFGLVAAALCSLIRIPRIIGILFVGILLGPNGLNMLDASILMISVDLRQMALIIILDFFTNHPHEAFSAKEILSVLGDETISLSAVYRNLSTLEGMNLIGRCSKNGTREAFFIPFL